MLAFDLLHDWLSLRLVPEMNRARFYALMERFPTPADVFGSTAAEIAAVRGFNPQLAAAVLASNATERARLHIDKMNRADVRVVTRDCEDYPFGLSISSLSPPLIFVKGTLAPEDKYSVSLVGSRHATTYGRSVARELAEGLARYGLTVVSGFARGIDGEAHHAAVRAGGRTIAVLGNGLDICYPSEHHVLTNEVISHGAMITEYPLGTPPERYNFPERNHVIAAFSLGTVVVEAAEKSGSLITARLALDENRFVFAVPGDITRNNSRGANRLIQNGACMVQRAKDVLIEMKDVLRGYLDVDVVTAEKPPVPVIETAPPIERRTRNNVDWVDQLQDADLSQVEKLANDLHAGQKPPAVAAPVPPRPAEMPAPAPVRPAPSFPVGSDATVPGRQLPANVARALSEDERFIVDLLHHEAMIFDDLADRAYGRGLDVPRLTSLLIKLEMKKVIRQLPGRYYVLFS